MLYDISRPLTSSTAVWPGDTPVNMWRVQSINAGDAVNVSGLTLSSHAATHVDAPLHFDNAGAPIGEIALERYIGPATVVHLDLDGAIAPEHLMHVDLARVERLLVRTRASHRANDAWSNDFAFLLSETATLLGECGVRLFGTDAPSVDPMTSKTLAAHHALLRGDVLILEGLYLRDVPEGDYELIALPLKLPLDGSPVRAVLRALE